MLGLNKQQIAEAFDEDEVLTLPDHGNVQWPFLNYFGWMHSSVHLGFVILQSPNDGQNRGIRVRRVKRSAQKLRMDIYS